MAVRVAIAVVCAVAAAGALLATGAPTHQRAAAGATRSPALLAFTAKSRSSALTQVFVLHRDGTVSQLTHGRDAASVASWAPDGRHLLVVRTDRDGQRLESISPASGRGRELWRGTLVADARWSPDGAHIAVEWDGKVSILNADGSVLRTLGEVVPADPAEAGGIAWSPDGSLLAVTYLTPTGNSVALEQPRGEVPRILSPCGRSRPCRDISHPDWANGSRALVVVRRDAGRSTLWWWTGHGPPSPLPARGLPGGIESAVWSPASPGLAVVTPAGLYVLPAPGGRAVRLTTTRPAGAPAWAPDGARIAFASAGPGDPAALSVVRVTSGTGVSYRSFAREFQDVVGAPAWRPVA
ncbi:MAG TPA: hypothetical protein VGC71_08885 [Gaiellales bacterium]|jgi:hypothetical protein